MHPFPNIHLPNQAILCGPSCIVACLDSFNLRQHSQPRLLRRFSMQSMTFTGELIRLDTSQTLTSLLAQLYQVTGILSEGDYVEFVPEHGFNSLAAMHHVLSQFGFETEMVFRDPSTRAYMTEAFRSEATLMKDLGVPAVYYSPQWRQKESILIAVIAYERTIHLVACNHRGEWFDSDLPEHIYYWDDIEHWQQSQNKRGKAQWMGIAMRVWFSQKEH
ncbi:hypothetical protein VST7929_01706 [Vibrio stylophorae]|uniref:Peptidase C39 domain-containing protein n=1 Tax=Vibrio stylophorae TaxID=659351 RepID=A0ABN8DV02_9VIBR|nr:hypothetical protein [Vibrio stylophorae]CAH0533831.1 hypothetical protein VST7929_01706 [Vibrio stylophorae]